MQPHVGFYVHYHGLGHKHRTEAILGQLSLPATVLTSRIHSLDWTGPTLREVLGLACDIDGVPEAGLRRAADVQTLHYAPLWTSTCTQRVKQFADWVERVRPALMVVDVSAEISMLTRLCSIPQLVMRQHGIRSDPGHTAAYEAAEALLAPFPECMEDDRTPDWVRERTVYLNGFAKSDAPVDRSAARRQLPVDSEQKMVVAMFGRGGHGVPLQQLVHAAQQTPGHHWYAIGQVPQDDVALPQNLTAVGWTEQPQLWLAAADVVVTAAGHNSIMEVGRQRRPLIAVAEARPFDEQLRKVAVLNREHLAVGVAQWPDPAEWPELIERASRLNVAAWDGIYQADGAAQAAACIEQYALRSREVAQGGGNRRKKQHV